MSEPKKEEKKRGFLPWLSNLFKGKTPMARGGMGAASGAGRAGVSGMGEAAGLGRTALSAGRAASGLGSSGSGLSGLFATKAGIVGIVLGGATLAAGIGVLYNFLGPSSKSGMTPQLFQNAYYDEQAQNASLGRSNLRNGSVDGSLDMFKEQAKKDGLALGEEGAAEGDQAANPADASADAAAAEPPAVPGANQAPKAPVGPSRLQAGGFGGMGGGGSSSMSGGGGGAAGGKFGSAYKAPVGAGGKTSKMGAKAASIVGGAKYALPSSKKGAFGQATFAGKLGNKAAYSTGAGARNAATEAFSGETTGTGDVASPGGGSGLGQNAAGLGNVGNLKPSDPNTDGSSFTPPTVPDAEDVSPWNDLRDEALKYIMIGLGLVILTKILGKIAKAVPWVYYAAVATAIGAMLAGLYVMYIGYKLYKGDPNGNPPWTGQLGLAIPMALAGLVIVIQAWNALCDIAGTQSTGTTADGKQVTGQLTTGKDGVQTITGADGKTLPIDKLTGTGAPSWLSGLGGAGLGNVLGGM